MSFARRGDFYGLLAFVALLAAFWWVSGYFGIRNQLGNHVPSTILSFALLLGPYWAFGFGIDAWLRQKLETRAVKIACGFVLIVPYLVFALPRGEFQWSLCLGLLGMILAVSSILSFAGAESPSWPDWLTLVLLALAVELHFFDRAWPVPGLSGLAKLLFVDLALYGYLVVRPIGRVGFDLRLRLSDAWIGLREFAFYAPIALVLGFGMGFLHTQAAKGGAFEFAAAWLFTFFFVALPEELFFRGLLLNMVERRVGSTHALWITSVLFG
ncbi:MAG TPA: CPBP family intramembrane glutamic endopeptidase [Bryobacteraceae bacterium]|nr:CPBP family intramembrane glutamic endopeptidase [Bryobacteraceae bacterium]